MKHMGILAVVILSLTVLVSTAEAQTCASCGITPENVDVWRSLDATGDGMLSSSDIFGIIEIMNLSGDNSLTRSDLVGLWLNQFDFNGDGVFNSEDTVIAWNLVGWIRAVGVPALDQAALNCLGRVILGVCDN